MLSTRPANLLSDRRHLRVHRVPRRRRARARPGHPRRPHRRRRLLAAAVLPPRQARGRRRVHVRLGRADRRDDAARHDRALLLRLPTAAPRRPPGDVVRVQRLRPHPRSQPEVRRPSRRRDPAEGRRPPGAPRVGRHRRPPIAEERGRRAPGDRGLRAAHQACIDAAGIVPADLDMQPITETYDRIGDVPAGRSTSSVDGRRRKIAPASSSGRTSRSSMCPSRRACRRRSRGSFLTAPGRRMTWQPWVTEVSVEGATGGRRGPGSSNHCMHGKDAVIEEILDWRPYDYVTDRTILATPGGPLRLLHTIELEPTDRRDDRPHAIRTGEDGP